jgi:hypothetical protein
MIGIPTAVAAVAIGLGWSAPASVAEPIPSSAPPTTVFRAVKHDFSRGYVGRIPRLA